MAAGQGRLPARAVMIAGAAIAAMVGPAAADTLRGALSRAYQVNPQLNSQRSIVRQTDEAVPQALSGYRPQVKVTGGAGNRIDVQQAGGNPAIANKYTYSTSPNAIGVTAQQTLFNGFQTANRTRAAESKVLAAREILRVIEQTVLLDAAAAYMDVLRDAAILDVERGNVQVLEETLRQTRRRFKLGEVTQTDVAQAEAQLASGRSQLLGADANLTASRAAYRRVIGSSPAHLEPGSPVDDLSPRTLAAAIDAGITSNPSVKAAMYGVDVAQLQVKISEAALYPTVTLQANLDRSHDVSGLVSEQSTAAVLVGVTIPLYQGGAEYSAIRQSKEALGQRRLDLASTRDEARAAVVKVWGLLQAAKAQIQAAQEQMRASEVALKGVRMEARLGLRTTLDVLNAQQTLVNAQVNLLVTQRDRVVASYKLLAAVGRLSPVTLALSTSVYDPVIHYQQVRDAWGGVRTPDGR